MANTVLEFPIRPYFGGSSTADGAVTPVAVVPTTLFLQRTDSGSQVAPAGAGYALTNTAGWLYQATASEALVGLYYWYVEDADSQVIADGYIVIGADDSGPYRAGANAAEAKMATHGDPTIVLESGVYKWQLRQRGTAIDLVPKKTVKQPDGSNLTDPATQRFAGYEE